MVLQQCLRGAENNSLVSRETQALDRRNLVEEGRDGVLVGAPGDVGDEESIALGADDIAVLLGTLVAAAASTLTVVGPLLGEVQSHVAAVEERAVLLVVGLLGGLGGREVDVSEAARPAGVPVGDDTGAEQVAEALELLEESIVVDVPGEVADE